MAGGAVVCLDRLELEAAAMSETTAKLILLALFVVGLIAVMEVVGLLWCSLMKRDERIPNKWERMTGMPCQPHDRTGLPTSPPPPKRGDA